MSVAEIDPEQSSSGPGRKARCELKADISLAAHRVDWQPRMRRLGSNGISPETSKHYDAASAPISDFATVSS
jgi:hypothetical protein